jgi:hypothetical protein
MRGSNLRRYFTVVSVYEVLHTTRSRQLVGFSVLRIKSDQFAVAIELNRQTVVRSSSAKRASVALISASTTAWPAKARKASSSVQSLPSRWVLLTKCLQCPSASPLTYAFNFIGS